MNKRKNSFYWKLLIYAEVFILLLCFGLIWFWNYIEAYEATRPRNIVDSYMQTLTAERLIERSADLIGSVDPMIQTEDACSQVIQDSLSGGITYAKHVSESTETESVYMLLSGGKTIGKIKLACTSTDKYGFTHWTVEEESFDLSHLLRDPISITVPHDYAVYAGDVLLGQEHITETNIPYAELEEFYGAYDLPYLVTYCAGPFLGDVAVTVNDSHGEPAAVEDGMDMSQFLPRCDDATETALSDFVDRYVEHYVAFTSGGNGTLHENCNKLTEYMVPGGELAKRMYDAIAGLSWVKDRGAKVSGIDIHHSIDIGNGRYLCDLTYHVDTTNFSGAVQVSSSIKLIVVQTNDGFKAEAMITY